MMQRLFAGIGSHFRDFTTVIQTTV